MRGKENMKFTTILITFLLLVVVSTNTQAAELVRVRISAMDGSEPGTINSSTYPSLFVIDSRIASAELTFQNPAAPTKNNLGPATWMPALTPSSVSAPQPGGYIQLTITPVTGQPISYGSITYTTSARYAANPSSLRLLSSQDGFSSTLAVINLDSERTGTVNLTTTASDSPFIFQWIAADDFGANGGGEAGFSSNDLVVSDVPAATTPVPTLTEWGLMIFMVFAGLGSVHYLKRQRRSESLRSFVK
jgi:hypothetical protein